MKVIATDISQDLTSYLLEQAKLELLKGQKIYYIVPSALSFEKEKELLERMADVQNQSETAFFDLIVTRFKQLPYYFEDKNLEQSQTELSQVGMSMLFKKVIKSFERTEIPLFYSQQNSPGFFDMLIRLREELIKGNLTVADLPDNAKNEQLAKIISRFEEELAEKYANYSEMDEFLEDLAAGQFDQKLANISIMIDGYSRFSAEEEKIISALHARKLNIVIGIYAKESQNPEQSVYSDSLRLIARLKKAYQAEVIYLNQQDVSHETFSKLSAIWESENDFIVREQTQLTENEAEKFEIWAAENPKVELEHLAISIIHEIVNQKAKFKDFSVYLGNMTSYRTQLMEIFELYQIPYFYAAEESMANHPLIILLESLYALKKANYRTQDIINLLKTGLYSLEHSSDSLNLAYLDDFEYFISQYKIHGKSRVQKSFANYVTDQALVNHFKQIEQIRMELLSEKSALNKLLDNNKLQTGQKLVENFQLFLKKGQILSNLNQRFDQAEEAGNHVLSDRHEQVWSLLNRNCAEFLAVFADEKMKMIDFLELLLTGFKNANYRQVPANVDVVKINDYTSIEPHSNQFIYVLGLSQSNFPRINTNSSLLSDEERAKINENTDEDSFIEQLNLTNYSKHKFTVLSLLNSAKKKLVLSMPEIHANEQDEASPILQLLLEKSKIQVKSCSAVNLSETTEFIGNHRALVSNLGKIERELAANTNEKDKRSFWGSMFKIQAKNNPQFRKVLLSLEQDIKAKDLSKETVEEMYSDKIHASVSAFESFYNCEYQYFLSKSLGLQEFEELDLDSRTVGNFFHEVFEQLLSKKEVSSQEIDRYLPEVVNQVYSKYQIYFEQDAYSKFTAANLKEIVNQTAVILKKTYENGLVSVEATESGFGPGQNSQLGEFNFDDISLRGRIDRIDQLFGDSIAAIDYKSGARDFDIKNSYDGLSLQLLTYLDVLHEKYPKDQLFGALYLQVKNEALKLSDLKNLSDINQKILENMRYKGVLLNHHLDEVKEQLPVIAGKSTNIFKENELDLLLEKNRQLYSQASQKIKGGKIDINPVVDANKNVKGCAFCPMKSICRFESNVHLPQARKVGLKNRQMIMDELKGVDLEDND